MYLRSIPCAKQIVAYGYRRVRVNPTFVIETSWTNPKEQEDLDRFHQELCKRAGVDRDNHQSFILDDKIVLRFDDNTILVGSAADAEIKDYGWW